MMLCSTPLSIPAGFQGSPGVAFHSPASQNPLAVCLCLYRDEDMDGEWEAPQIANPKCESAPGCGVWQRPMIDNPNYKGRWKPPMIDNPNYQVGTS